MHERFVSHQPRGLGLGLTARVPSNLGPLDGGDPRHERQLFVLSASLGFRHGQWWHVQHQRQHRAGGRRGRGLFGQIWRMGGLHRGGVGRSGHGMRGQLCFGTIQFWRWVCELTKFPAHDLHRQHGQAFEQLHGRAHLHHLGQHQHHLATQSLSQLF